MIQNFNNKTEKVGDDLKKNIKQGGKLKVAAAIFSIYGYESLKTELSKIDELSFIFTDPTFVEMDKNNREQRMVIAKLYQNTSKIMCRLINL